MFRALQAEGVPALGKEMDLCREARVVKGTRVNRAVADIVHGVIPRLLMPLAVIQSHISVPSRSIAKSWNPPPGKTTIDAPVFLPLGGKTVMVGEVTS